MENAIDADLTKMDIYACWSCDKSIDPTDHYCRFCGKGQGRFVPWYYHHWGIFVLTLLAVGPFSIFFVWLSPIISKRAKWIYTLAIGALTWYATVKVYELWLTAQKLMATYLQGMQI